MAKVGKIRPGATRPTTRSNPPALSKRPSGSGKPLTTNIANPKTVPSTLGRVKSFFAGSGLGGANWSGTQSAKDIKNKFEGE